MQAQLVSARWRTFMLTLLSKEMWSWIWKADLKKIYIYLYTENFFFYPFVKMKENR